jgi:hypothetical protein
MSLITWNYLLKRFSTAEEPLYCTAFFIEFRIRPEWPPTFQLFPEFLVDRDIDLYSSFPVAPANFPGIIGGSVTKVL